MLFYKATREYEAMILTGRSWSFKQKVWANHCRSQRCGRPSRTLSLLAHARNQRLAISLRCAAKRFFPTEPQDAAMLSYIARGMEQLAENSRERQTKGTSCVTTSMSFRRHSTSTQHDATRHDTTRHYKIPHLVWPQRLCLWLRSLTCSCAITNSCSAATRSKHQFAAFGSGASV